VGIASSNGISIDLQSTNVLAQDQYVEVSSDFNNATTAELVTLGENDSVNIFFIEGFTGIGGGGRLGISPGIPGTLGVQGPYNGLLINATATVDGPSDYYARTTAEFAFHEMGHLLGLFHTTESNFKNDIIDDTPNCDRATDDTAVNDFDNRIGVADPNECADGFNPMFWTNDFNTPKQNLTAEQRRLIYYSPIAK
jgi:predicted Zn-dependent protease